MWLIKCKSDKDSKSWSTVGAFDYQAGAINYASSLFGKRSNVIVTEKDGTIIWMLYEISEIYRKQSAE